MPVVQVSGGLIDAKPVILLRQGIMDAHDGRLAIMRVDPEGARVGIRRIGERPDGAGRHPVYVRVEIMLYLLLNELILRASKAWCGVTLSTKFRPALMGVSWGLSKACDR